MARRRNPINTAAMSAANAIINAQLLPLNQEATVANQQGTDTQQWLSNLGGAYQQQIASQFGASPDSAQSRVGQLLGSAAGQMTAAQEEPGKRLDALRSVLGNIDLNPYAGAQYQSQAAQQMSGLAGQGGAHLDWLRRSAVVGGARTKQNKESAKTALQRALQEINAKKMQVRASRPEVYRNLLQAERQWWLDRKNVNLAAQQFGLSQTQADREYELGKEANAISAMNAASNAAGKGDKKGKTPAQLAAEVYKAFFVPNNGVMSPGSMEQVEVTAADGTKQTVQKFVPMKQPWRGLFSQLRNNGLNNNQAALWATRYMMRYDGQYFKDPAGNRDRLRQMGVSKAMQRRLLKTMFKWASPANNGNKVTNVWRELQAVLWALNK